MTRSCAPPPAEGVAWWALAERNPRAFTGPTTLLGCRPPDIEPRATGHIPDMIALIERLIEGGHAYAAGGDVYFDVHSSPSYGALSGQRLDQMRPAEDSDERGQAGPPRLRAVEGRPSRASRPGRRPGDPAGPAGTWSARPWRPATSGPAFDIHGGGMDLVFPHHENELAQSRAAGDGFARYWLHNGLLGLAGEKMSKSLGQRAGWSPRPGPGAARGAPLLPGPGALPVDARVLRGGAGRGGRGVPADRALRAAGRRDARQRGPGPARGPGTTRPAGCPPRSVRRWTRTSPSRPRWPRCTPASGTATRPWPPGQDGHPDQPDPAPRHAGVLGLDPLAPWQVRPPGPWGRAPDPASSCGR